jgi:endonuclease YncB( thermonuclease family)
MFAAGCRALSAAWPVIFFGDAAMRSVSPHKVLAALFRLRDLAIASAALLICVGLWSAPSCRALDGQTLRCGRERISLHSVYAPAVDLRGGKEAKQRLQRRIRAGDLLIFRLGRDMYGNTVAMVYVDGRLIRQADLHPHALSVIPLRSHRGVFTGVNWDLERSLLP